MRELQIFRAVLQKDEDFFSVSDETKMSIWKEIIRKVFGKDKKERETSNEL